jgi:hypothetical protein
MPPLRSRTSALWTNGLTAAHNRLYSPTGRTSCPRVTVTVVPDSGTGELNGLAGQMTITIADGKHSYDLEYTLPSGR